MFEYFKYYSAMIFSFTGAYFFHQAQNHSDKMNLKGVKLLFLSNHFTTGKHIIQSENAPKIAEDEWNWIFIISVGQTVGSRAKIRWANISSEWAESCPNKGITAGCCQNGCSGLFVKYLETKYIQSTRTRFKLTLYMQNALNLHIFTSDSLM